MQLGKVIQKLHLDILFGLHYDFVADSIILPIPDRN